MSSREYPFYHYPEIPLKALALPATSLDRAVVTVACRIVRQTAKAIAYRYLTQAMKLTMRRFNDAVSDRLQAAYVTHDPRGVSDAVERQWAMRRRYDWLVNERFWVSGWTV